MTIVFVHGFLGGSQQWSAQVEALRDHKVIAVDLPGFGENAELAPLNQIGDFANWVLAHLTDLGVDRFCLVGHSMGGMVAQEMVARAPDRIERLVLYGTGPTGNLPGRFEPIAVSKERARNDGAPATARRIAATWFLKNSAAKAYEDCAALAAKSSLSAMLAGLDAMRQWSGEERLEQIKAKTLVVWGDQDRTYAWPQTEQLWRKITGASLAVFPECAHAIHLEKPELFNSVLLDFVDA